MSPGTVTLDEALELLRLPRAVGIDPDTGEEIVAANGRFGPYLKRGTDTRSLTRKSSCSPSTLDEALALSPSPRRGGAGPPRRRLRELGADPDTAQPIVREGAAASARTSPTAPPTRRCAGATTSSPSRSSGRPSCWPSAGPPDLRPGGERRRPSGRQRRPRPRRHRPRRPANEGSAKKTTAKKAAAKRAAGTKATTRKATAKKASDDAASDS